MKEVELFFQTLAVMEGERETSGFFPSNHLSGNFSFKHSVTFMQGNWAMFPIIARKVFTGPKTKIFGMKHCKRCLRVVLQRIQTIFIGSNL